MEDITDDGVDAFGAATELGVVGAAVVPVARLACNTKPRIKT